VPAESPTMRNATVMRWCRNLMSSPFG
jgi:hypothetical protein